MPLLLTITTVICGFCRTHPLFAVFLLLLMCVKTCLCLRAFAIVCICVRVLWSNWPWAVNTIPSVPLWQWKRLHIHSTTRKQNSGCDPAVKGWMYVSLLGRGGIGLHTTLRGTFFYIQNYSGWEIHWGEEYSQIYKSVITFCPWMIVKVCITAEPVMVSSGDDLCFP